MEAPQRNIPTYLGLSIFTMMCCCLPLGLAALITSHEVDNAMRAGDINRAASSSRTARTLNIIGIVVGIIALIVATVFWVTIFNKEVHRERLPSLP
ncbi:hypothetical protein lerEdw1_012172 [Lerista edwardsae]|nr:hypothetical protein lerEdw1_012172 [Lerista edwardsae]